MMKVTLIPGRTAQIQMSGITIFHFQWIQRNIILIAREIQSLKHSVMTC